MHLLSLPVFQGNSRCSCFVISMHFLRYQFCILKLSPHVILDFDYIWLCYTNARTIYLSILSLGPKTFLGKIRAHLFSQYACLNPWKALIVLSLILKICNMTQMWATHSVPIWFHLWCTVLSANRNHTSIFPSESKRSKSHPVCQIDDKMPSCEIKYNWLANI